LPRADGEIAQDHARRLRGAGRVGTKRFVDPCRVFFGNLHFATDEAGLAGFVASALGLPPAVCLLRGPNGANVVRDWRTGRSKGYGFCVFTEPVYATATLDKCHGRVLDGRAVTVAQAARRRRPAENQLYVVRDADRTERNAGSGEDRAIRDALQKADGEGVDDDDENKLELLRILDPDLAKDGSVTYGSDDYEALLEEEEEEESGGDNRSMNRAQRRQAARSTRKTKPQSKGFG
jgi:RNA recognition motif-containing protein